jgi:hypothetical protein
MTGNHTKCWMHEDAPHPHCFLCADIQKSQTQNSTIKNLPIISTPAKEAPWLRKILGS